MFGPILNATLSFLKVKAFDKGADGKSILTDEQKKTLTAKWGSTFVESFEKDLAAHESTEDPGDDGKLDAKALQAANEQYAKDLKAAQDRLTKLDATIAKHEATIAKLEGEETPDNGEQVENNGGEMTAFKPNMKLGINQRIDATHFGKPLAASYTGDDTIDTTELQQEFGRYVSSEKMEIFRSLMGQTSSTQYMTTMITDKFIVKASHAHITSVLQSFVPEWTPKGKSTFTPLTIEQHIMKINVPIIPSDIIDEVIGYLYDEKLDPKDMPIVRYIVENLIRPILDEEREQALAIGVYKEPTQLANGSYVANNALEVMDGYLTQLCRIKKDGNTKGVNFVFDGKSFGEGNQLLADVESAVDEVKPLYKNKKLFIHADPDFILKYSRAYRDKYPTTKNQDGENVKVDYTNFTFVPLEGMRGTGAWFITPKENFRHLMSRNPRDQKLRMETNDYTVKVFGEWREGVGFWLAEAIFAYIPDALVTRLLPDAEGSTGSGSGSGSAGGI